MSNYYKLKRLIEKILPVKENFSKNSNFKNEDGEKGIIYISVIDCDGGQANDSLLLALLTHEFGHYLSSQNYPNEYNESLRLSDKHYNGGKLSKFEKDLVIEEEINAWKYGEKYITENGFSIESEFYVIKEKCLKSYYDGPLEYNYMRR